LDLFGALLNHHFSSSDLFTFHILRGLVFLLEHYLRWFYSILYPLTSWREYKPNYYPLHIAILFLFSHLFTGSRAFVLLDDLPYHRGLSSLRGSPPAHETYQKYLTNPDSSPRSNLSDEKEDEEDQLFQLFLSPVCLLMMISESILCNTSGLLIAIAYLSSWQSILLILMSLPSLVADLVVMITLYWKRSRTKRILVLDRAEMQLDDALSRIPQSDLTEAGGARGADCENNLTEKREDEGIHIG
jgi:hypothetical protein